MQTSFFSWVYPKNNKLWRKKGGWSWLKLLSVAKLLCFSSIARATGIINETTVRTRLYRALRRLPAGVAARASAERGAVFKLEPALGDKIIKGVLAGLKR